MKAKNVLGQPPLRLKPYTDEEDALTVAWLNDDDLRRRFGLSYQVDLHSHRQWRSQQLDLYLWSIEADGEHVGNVSLRVNERHRSGCVEIYFGVVAARGRGLGRRVMTHLLDFAFTELHLHRVWLYALSDNKAANVLYHRLGFHKEGVQRESVWREGKFHDQYCWSMLAGEWQQQSQPGRAVL